MTEYFVGPLALSFVALAAAGFITVVASHALQGRTEEHQHKVGSIGSIIFGCAVTLYLTTVFIDLTSSMASLPLSIAIVAFSAIVGGVMGLGLYTYVPTVVR